LVNVCFEILSILEKDHIFWRFLLLYFERAHFLDIKPVLDIPLQFFGVRRISGKVCSPIQGHSVRPKITTYIPARPNPTSGMSNYSSQAKINFPHSKPLQPGQTRLSLFQGIAGSLKPTSANPIHSRQPKTDFPHSKPFQSGKNQPHSFKLFQSGRKQLPPFQPGQNQLPPFKPFQLRYSYLAKTNHVRQFKTDFLYSMPF
jgi:hypothetical protein